MIICRPVQTLTLLCRNPSGPDGSFSHFPVDGSKAAPSA
jgi:hypothetical protein